MPNNPELTLQTWAKRVRSWYIITRLEDMKYDLTTPKFQLEVIETALNMEIVEYIGIMGVMEV